AAWLSPQGRMLTDMHVLQSAGMILLDVPADQASAVLARLDQFLFSEDVRIEPLVEAMTGVWLHGPRAASVISNLVSGFSRIADVGSASGRIADVESGSGRITDVGSGFSRIADWNDYQHDTATFDGNPV